MTAIPYQTIPVTKDWYEPFSLNHALSSDLLVNWLPLETLNRVATCAYPVGDAMYLQILGELESFAQLEANWDSYGGSPISERAVSEATRVIESCKVWGLEFPEVVPMSSGGVALEWHSDLAEVEIEVIGPSRINYFIEKNGFVREGEIFPLPAHNQIGKFRDLIDVMFDGIKTR